MIQATTMLYLYVETPLHAGTGAGLSSIDLPVQRERTTRYPMIQGSGIKGKLRSAAYLAGEQDGSWTSDDITIVFGPEGNGAAHAGALIAGDARILLFPVRSLSGVFAYTTSCDVLSRFQRDMTRSGEQLGGLIEGLSPDELHTAQVTEQVASAVVADNALVLEEFSFQVTRNAQVDAIAQWIAKHALPQTPVYAYWRKKVENSLVILPENDFRDFVVHATEVITRVKIKRETKTVEGGALWTEEHLPTDTLLYVPVYATNARKMKSENDGKSRPEMVATAILSKAQSLEKSQNGYLQLGGDETVGRGMVRMHWDSPQKEN
jgi:CRISPR-associated protein Cmr4